MKSIPNLQNYKNELMYIFLQSKDAADLSVNLTQLFLKMLNCDLYMTMPGIRIIATESLQYSVWCENPCAETETVNIHQGKCDLYLWRCADQKWYLNDLYDDIHEIAEKILTDIPVFKSIPENPKEVKTLLENGLMIFKPKIFPVFSKIKPHDLNEVLTWDDRFLLVGTKVENLKVYSYEEWNDLIIRENYFKNNGE